MPDRVALYLQDHYTLPQSIQYVKYAEARGFEAVWQAETTFTRDSLITIAAYATATSHIKIGSAVTNIYTRHVATLAAELLTLDDLAPNRIICGLGTWQTELAQKIGINREKHLLALRETVTSLRQLLAMQSVTHYGQFIQLHQLQLKPLHDPRPRRIPLYIGATGPKLLALAGDIADGVLLNYMVTPQYNQRAMEQIAIGLRQSRRSLYDLDRPQLIMCSLHHDRQRALDAARQVVAQFILQQPQLMRSNGIPATLIAELTQWHARGTHTLNQIADRIPDDIVQQVTATGTPGEVRAKVREYVQTGATYPILYPLNHNVRALIDAFASGYTADI